MPCIQIQQPLSSAGSPQDNACRNKNQCDSGAEKSPIKYAHKEIMNGDVMFVVATLKKLASAHSQESSINRHAPGKRLPG